MEKRGKMVEEKVIEFVRECRRRGFSNEQIKDKLIEGGWSFKEIDEAINFVKKTTQKIRLCIGIDEEVAKMLIRRAKRNMMSVEEQAEDILRRSCVSMRKKPLTEEKIVGNHFISIFSRRKYGGEKSR
ncbi:MAG: hypothetical protein N3D20_02265 [Candidatus Pacearchaeota archaeon]|nr:hypothetical protein [Candidatus Pacearchaeota archaeon]